MLVRIQPWALMKMMQNIKRRWKTNYNDLDLAPKNWRKILRRNQRAKEKVEWKKDVAS